MRSADRQQSPHSVCSERRIYGEYELSAFSSQSNLESAENVESSRYRSQKRDDGDDILETSKNPKFCKFDNVFSGFFDYKFYKKIGF